MAGSQIPRILVVFSAIIALNCVSTLPRDIIFPTADENLAGNPELAAYPPSVNDQPIKMHEQEDKPKDCFHFYVSRNMSSLLAEATKMLRTIRDRREREWILTFIYRIKSLAEHLRAHPNSRNYDCLSTDEETKKRFLNDNAKGQPQPELYFVDDVPKRSDEGGDLLEEAVEVKSNDNQTPNGTSIHEQAASNVPKDQEPDLKPPPSQTLSSAETASDNTLTDSNDEEKDIPTSKLDAAAATGSNADYSSQKNGDEIPSVKREKADDNSIVLSSAPDCDANTKCKNSDDTPTSHDARENYFADAGNIYPPYQPDEERERDFEAEELYREQALKERIRKALLEELAPEIKKLKTVGGTEEDLRNIWRSHYIQDDKSMEQNEEADFDYEETGAAVGDLNLNDNVHPDRTVAPSLDEVQNSKEHSNHPKDSSYEPYDDSDVLVKQLFDVRYDNNNNNNNPPSKSTKSFSDQNNEYLITSTHIPF